VLSAVAFDETDRQLGYLSKSALLLGFRSTVEIIDTKKDSQTVAKFFQTE